MTAKKVSSRRTASPSATAKKSNTKRKATKKAPASQSSRAKKTVPTRDFASEEAFPLDCYEKMLRHFADENRLRHIPPVIPDDAEPPLDLLSNDYLGLGADAYMFRDEFRRRFPDAEFSSSASRLLSRKNKYHNMLEARLEELYGRPALLFNSGYHANVGVIQALAVPGTMFVADKLVHASVIDGLRLSEADFKRFPHNDPRKAERIIKENYDEYARFVVVIESVYSMDGDIAPLRRFAELKKRYPKVMLYVDEAHAFGVLGNRGLGLAEELDLIPEIDILVGTLGKAAASAGAFVIVSPMMKEYLINCARSLIFSTAISPAQAAWSVLMLEKLVEASDRRKNLARLSRELVKQLENRANIETPSSTHIVPIIIGDAGEALNMAEYLRQNGFDTLAIRKPTVPSGSERLRLSLNATITKNDITRLVTLIANYH